MAAIPQRFLTSTTLTGSLVAGDTATSGATDATTILTYGTTTGSRRVTPKTNTSTALTAPAVNTAAANVGVRENTADHPSQDSAATSAPASYQISGVWTFVYSMGLSSGTTALTTQMTVICYAITTGGVSRELWRHTSGSMSVGLTEANYTHTTTSVAAVTVNTGERLQYEFYLNASVNGNLTSAAVLFRLGAAGVALTAPTVTGGTIVGIFTRATTDSAPATDVQTRTLLLPRTLTDTLSTLDTAARAVITTRGLPETVAGLDALARKYLAARALTDTTSVLDSIARGLALTRALSESLPTIATLAVSFAGTRAITETLTTADTAARKFVGARAVTDTTVTADSITRLLQAIRAVSESVPIGVDTAARKVTLTRGPVENLPTTDSLARVLTYVRATVEYPPGATPDYPLSFPTKTISGVARSSSGAPVAGAVVKLVRQSDDKAVVQTTSAADGSYSFSRDTFDPNAYYVLAYLTGTPQTHGVTDRDLIPA